MGKSIEEMKEALEAKQMGSLVNDILELVDAEKSKGVDLHRKQNSENQKLRAYKKALEAVGLTEDDDLDEFTADLVNLKTKKSTDDGTGRLTMNSLQDQIKTLQKTLDAERNKSVENEKKLKSKTIAAKLTQSLSDKVYGADLLIKSLINDGQVDLDGEDVVFKNNGESIPYDQGINTLLETRKDIVKSSQKGGAGTTQTSTTPKSIENILQSNDPNAIKANLPELAKAMGIKL